MLERKHSTLRQVQVQVQVRVWARLMLLGKSGQEKMALQLVSRVTWARDFVVAGLHSERLGESLRMPAICLLDFFCLDDCVRLVRRGIVWNIVS